MNPRERTTDPTIATLSSREIYRNPWMRAYSGEVGT
jgi:hypothetical protein